MILYTLRSLESLRKSLKKYMGITPRSRCLLRLLLFLLLLALLLLLFLVFLLLLLPP